MIVISANLSLRLCPHVYRYWKKNVLSLRFGLQFMGKWWWSLKTKLLGNTDIMTSTCTWKLLFICRVPLALQPIHPCLCLISFIPSGWRCLVQFPPMKMSLPGPCSISNRKSPPTCLRPHCNIFLHPKILHPNIRIYCVLLSAIFPVWIAHWACSQWHLTQYRPLLAGASLCERGRCVFINIYTHIDKA